ncbi:MAG: uroporphyrinogen-III synthase [Albidovulum sp.]
MAGNRPTLLLTRPAEPARRFLADLRAAFGRDLPAVISPLMETRFLDLPLPEHENVVFTSETAVKAVVRLGGPMTALAWCVGPRTEAAARAAGYRTERGGGTAENLASEIVARRPAGRVFCPVATDQALDIVGALNSAGIETVSVVIYRQEPRPPSAEALALLAGDGAVILPLFSLRSARLAAAAFRAHRAPLWIAALSDQIAGVAKDLHPARIATASAPDAAALICAIAEITGERRSG